MIYTSDGQNFHGIAKSGFDWFDGYALTTNRLGNYLYYAANNNPIRYDLATGQWMSLRDSAWAADLLIGQVAATRDVLFCNGFKFSPSLQIFSYRSTNNGASWSLLSGGSNNMLLFDKVMQINDTDMVANLLNNMAYSQDKGLTWNESPKYHSRLNDQSVGNNGILMFPDEIFGVIRSQDSGQTWSYSNSGLKSFQIFSGVFFVKEMFKDGSNIFLTMEKNIDGDTHTVYRSTNNGASWSQLTNTPNLERMHYAGRVGSALFLRFNPRQDDGNNWQDQNCSFYMTKNGGNSWIRVSDNFYNSTKMNLRKVYGFAGKNGKYFLFAERNDDKPVVYYSSSGTYNSWQLIYTGNFSSHIRTIRKVMF